MLEDGTALVVELYAGEVGGRDGVKLGDEVVVTSRRVPGALSVPVLRQPPGLTRAQDDHMFGPSGSPCDRSVGSGTVLPCGTRPTRIDTSGLRYRYCGRSGLQFPPLSLGLWHNFGDATPLDTSVRCSARRSTSGITHFDLANNYGPPLGSAEVNFGRLLREDLAPTGTS